MRRRGTETASRLASTCTLTVEDAYRNEVPILHQDRCRSEDRSVRGGSGTCSIQTRSCGGLLRYRLEEARLWPMTS